MKIDINADRILSYVFVSFIVYIFLYIPQQENFKFCSVDYPNGCETTEQNCIYRQ